MRGATLSYTSYTKHGPVPCEISFSRSQSCDAETCLDQWSTSYADILARRIDRVLHTMPTMLHVYTDNYTLKEIYLAASPDNLQERCSMLLTSNLERYKMLWAKTNLLATYKEHYEPSVWFEPQQPPSFQAVNVLSEATIFTDQIYAIECVRLISLAEEASYVSYITQETRTTLSLQAQKIKALLTQICTCTMPEQVTATLAQTTCSGLLNNALLTYCAFPTLSKKVRKKISYHLQDATLSAIAAMHPMYQPYQSYKLDRLHAALLRLALHFSPHNKRARETWLHFLKHYIEHDRAFLGPKSHAVHLQHYMPILNDACLLLQQRLNVIITKLAQLEKMQPVQQTELLLKVGKRIRTLYNVEGHVANLNTSSRFFKLFDQYQTIYSLLQTHLFPQLVQKAGKIAHRNLLDRLLHFLGLNSLQFNKKIFDTTDSCDWNRESTTCFKAVEYILNTMVPSPLPGIEGQHKQLTILTKAHTLLSLIDKEKCSDEKHALCILLRVLTLFIETESEEIQNRCKHIFLPMLQQHASLVDIAPFQSFLNAIDVSSHTNQPSIDTVKGALKDALSESYNTNRELYNDALEIDNNYRHAYIYKYLTKFNPIASITQFFKKTVDDYAKSQNI